MRPMSMTTTKTPRRRHCDEAKVTLGYPGTVILFRCALAARDKKQFHRNHWAPNTSHR
jgi:hypothetical protein